MPVPLTRKMVLHSLVEAAKSRPCTRCGQCAPFDDMRLYHVPARGLKFFNPSASCNRSPEMVAEEIAKCDPYCVGCFVLVSYENGDHLRGIKPAALLIPGAPEKLASMLRREAKKADARERRRLRAGRMAIDRNVSGVPMAPYADLDDSDGT